MKNGEIKDAELERLALFVEESAEAIQIAGKILRHGKRSYDPTGTGFSQPNNTALIEKEIGDVLHAVRLMAKAGDIDMERIEKRVVARDTLFRRYTHYDQPLVAAPVQGQEKI